MNVIILGNQYKQDIDINHPFGMDHMNPWNIWKLESSNRLEAFRQNCGLSGFSKKLVDFLYLRLWLPMQIHFNFDM